MSKWEEEGKVRCRVLTTRPVDAEVRAKGTASGRHRTISMHRKYEEARESAEKPARNARVDRGLTAMAGRGKGKQQKTMLHRVSRGRKSRGRERPRARVVLVGALTASPDRPAPPRIVLPRMYLTSASTSLAHACPPRWRRTPACRPPLRTVWLLLPFTHVIWLTWSHGCCLSAFRGNLADPVPGDSA